DVVAWMARQLDRQGMARSERHACHGIPQGVTLTKAWKIALNAFTRRQRHAPHRRAVTSRLSARSLMAGLESPVTAQGVSQKRQSAPSGARGPPLQLLAAGAAVSVARSTEP